MSFKERDKLKKELVQKVMKEEFPWSRVMRVMAITYLYTVSVLVFFPTIPFWQIAATLLALDVWLN